ncbi:MAG TPA: hypothetical protein VM328_10960 [Fimbriimonadaceae bacterium]|nr:hypothetical protein [Fimbriimonadaceae bacterium]
MFKIRSFFNFGNALRGQLTSDHGIDPARLPDVSPTDFVDYIRWVESREGVVVILPRKFSGAGDSTLNDRCSAVLGILEMSDAVLSWDTQDQLHIIMDRYGSKRRLVVDAADLELQALKQSLLSRQE